MNFCQLLLKPKRERSILLRHPWIFSGAVESHSDRFEDGDIVEIISAQKEVLGYGFFSNRSQIVCRMFHWGTTDTDFENSKYWYQKILNALQIRTTMIISPETNSFRLLHAEGDFLPGIIADIYGEVAVIQILIKGIERRKHLFIEALQKAGFPNIYVRSKISSEKLEEIEGVSGWATMLESEMETETERATARIAPTTILENGLKFNVDFIGGQKTGFFLDQRDNRQLLRSVSAGKKVLNCFSYTGGFSVYALAGGATHVDSVDISESAIKMCEENINLNQSAIESPHSAIVSDCFEFLKEMPENAYDIIVLDPPAFAKSKRAVDNAARGYKQINMRAFQKIKPGGLVFTFSCSQNISRELFQKIIFGAAADARRNVRILYQLHQAPDHPINIFHPEGDYLKGLMLYVE